MKAGIFTETMILTSLITMFHSGGFGAFGALVHYLYLIVKDEGEFSYKTMFIFMIMGFFVAFLAELLMQDFMGEKIVTGKPPE